MAKVKISDWINENVTDDAVWGQYYIIVRKEEYRSGRKLLIEHTVPPARDATITGKEIKAHLEDSGPLMAVGIGCLIFGIVWIASYLWIGENWGSGVKDILLGPVLGLAAIVLGVLFMLACKKGTRKVSAISSWEDLYPHIEAALKEKVLSEEREKRKQEMGNQGEAFSGRACFTAREVLQDELGGVPLDLGLKMKMVAASVPESGLKLTRR